MNTKQYFGYTRVSTVKQGEHGVSLEQQREAISRYAEKNRLPLVRWFEEQETAAKRGRPVFGQMLKLLRQQQAAGVIIHKIDRSARNLKDWADLGELIDAGMEIHFANESLDLHSRGGRLSADIQAVVAADYIRNLREETKKGYYGRLKQGLYPRPAPLGYLNQGSGKLKVPDPVQGPIVRTAFELYGTGLFNLDRLCKEVNALGLRTRAGRPVTKSVLSRLLNNPFYMGLLSVRKVNQTYEGSHEPLVPAILFERVRRLLRGKIGHRVMKHRFLFRQLWTCELCGHCLIGETQNKIVYYRCHTRDCSSRTVRESSLEQQLVQQLRRLEFSQEEKDWFRHALEDMEQSSHAEDVAATDSLKLKLAQTEERLTRLTDAYLDQVIDKDTLEQRKTALHEERCRIRDKIERLTSSSGNIVQQLSETLELAGCAYLSYKFGLEEEKRELVKIVSSKRTLNGKSLTITMDLPFQLIAERFSVPCGRPTRDTGRVWNNLIYKLKHAVGYHVLSLNESA
jgi:site-specific DNA recombinase